LRKGRLVFGIVLLIIGSFMFITTPKALMSQCIVFELDPYVKLVENLIQGEIDEKCKITLPRVIGSIVAAAIGIGAIIGSLIRRYDQSSDDGYVYSEI